MKMRQIAVSQEYIDSLCEWMFEWVKKDDALVIPQFLQWKGIGYPYLKYFCHTNEKVNNTFEVVKAILHNRWFHKAMYTKELSSDKRKLLMRYLRQYDSCGIDIEEQIKTAVAEREALTEMKVYAENYAREELQQDYRGIYEENVDKRRDRGET